MTPPSNRARLALFSLAMLLAAVPAGAAIAPGVHLRTLEFGGITREYRMRVPASYNGSSPVPLVLDLHGLSSNATMQASGSGMGAVAEREGFIAVYPNGTGNIRGWNAGICCIDKSTDDVGFLRAVVAAVQAEASIDATRIYATGLSNGGAMSQRLACDAADLFAAAAPMAFPVPFDPLSGCQPSRAIPVLTFMGLTDVLVRYDGPVFPSARETFDYWRDINGCGTGAPNERVDRGMSYCETYTSCTNGVQAGLCSITAESFGGAPFDGHILYLNPDFVLAEVAWTFLSQFQLPAPSEPVHAVLSGPVTLKLPGKRQIKDTLSWTVTLGDGTWAATDADGAVFTGSAERRRRGRQLTLALTGDSQAALLRALAAEASAMAGADVTLTLAGARLGARVGRRGGRVRLAGKLDLTGNGAAGVTKARWVFRLRGGAAA